MQLVCRFLILCVERSILISCITGPWTAAKPAWDATKASIMAPSPFATAAFAPGPSPAPLKILAFRPPNQRSSLGRQTLRRRRFLLPGSFVGLGLAARLTMKHSRQTPTQPGRTAQAANQGRTLGCNQTLRPCDQVRELFGSQHLSCMILADIYSHARP